MIKAAAQCNLVPSQKFAQSNKNDELIFDHLIGKKMRFDISQKVEIAELSLRALCTKKFLPVLLGFWKGRFVTTLLSKPSQ